jgi:hypothetical protein
MFCCLEPQPSTETRPAGSRVSPPIRSIRPWCLQASAAADTPDRRTGDHWRRGPMTVTPCHPGRPRPGGLKFGLDGAYSSGGEGVLAYQPPEAGRRGRKRRAVFDGRRRRIQAFPCMGGVGSRLRGRWIGRAWSGELPPSSSFLRCWLGHWPPADRRLPLRPPPRRWLMRLIPIWERPPAEPT